MTSDESMIHFLIRFGLENMFFFIPMAGFGFMSFSKSKGVMVSGIVLAFAYAFLTLAGGFIKGHSLVILHTIIETLGFAFGFSVQTYFRRRKARREPHEKNTGGILISASRFDAKAHVEIELSQQYFDENRWSEALRAADGDETRANQIYRVLRADDLEKLEESNK